VEIHIGQFARAGIEAQLGPDIPAGIQAALSHYTARLAAGRAPVGFPSFRRETIAEPTGSDLELAVDPSVERTLHREGQRQKASLEQLVTHAVFVYLADLDALSTTA
jgi:hypothetical protein